MRPPVVGTLPTGDYYAIISRAKHRPKCDVYAWTVSDKVPVIPIPLKPEDADASVPFQEVFNIVYRRARYDLSVKYDAPLDPPLTSGELRWVQSPSNQS